MLAGAILSLPADSPRPNRALASVLIVLSVSVGAVVAEHAGMFGGTIWLILLEYTLAFVFAPALWFYVNTVLGNSSPRHPRSIRTWSHTLPAILWLVYLGALTVAIQSGLDTHSWQWLPPIMGLVVYMLSYTTAATVRYLRRDRNRPPLVVHSRALRGLLVSLYVLHGAQFARFLFRDQAWLSDLVPLTGTAIVYGFSIVAFRQSRLFSGHDTPPIESKYENSSLTAERAADIERELLLVLDRDKPYHNEDFNLSELASRLSIPRAHLSQVVNGNLGSSFPELLNQYRVREATRLLGDAATEHLTIEAIGYEVGFRSRSGFYSAYKRIANETPAQTRKRLLEGSS